MVYVLTEQYDADDVRVAGVFSSVERVRISTFDDGRETVMPYATITIEPFVLDTPSAEHDA